MRRWGSGRSCGSGAAGCGLREGQARITINTMKNPYIGSRGSDKSMVRDSDIPRSKHVMRTVQPLKPTSLMRRTRAVASGTTRNKFNASKSRESAYRIVSGKFKAFSFSQTEMIPTAKTKSQNCQNSDRDARRQKTK